MGSERGSQTSPTLLGRLRNLKDKQAWEEFVDRYAPRIYGWCRNQGLQNADAEDVTQEVLAKLARRMQTFVYAPNSSFRGWLKKVTHNAWVDFLENRQRTARGSGDSQLQTQWESIEAGDGLANELNEQFQRELLDEAMSRVQLRVTPQTWEVFRLLELEERCGAEVAQQFGMTVIAVYGVRNRVRTMLRQEVQHLEAPETKEAEP